MKKILLFLFLPLLVFGQSNLLKMERKSAYSVETRNLIGRMTVRPSVARIVLMDGLIKNLKRNNLWTKICGLYVLAAETEQQALLNWKQNNCNATNVNTMTFVANQGFTSDGATSYLNSNITPSVNMPNSLNSISIGIYIRTDVAQDKTDIGSYDAAGTSGLLINTRVVANTAMGRLNGLTTALTPASTDSRGFWLASRTASNATALYRNGSSIATGSNAAVALVDRELYVGCVHNPNGSAANYSTKQIAVVFIGQGLTATEAGILNTLIENYMDAIGTGVQ